MTRTTLLLSLFLFVLPHYVPASAQTTPAPAPSASPAPTALPAPVASPSVDEIDPEDVIRVKTTLVNSPVLVIGRDGKYVPHLGRQDFQVFEDGVPQEIAYFAPVDEPFTVALLLDVSRSVNFKLEHVQAAALSFVESMRAGDRALVVTFADEIKVLAEPTADRDLLRASIQRAAKGGGSRVYDAIDLVLTKHLDPIAGRKALILFSDGVDTASKTVTAPESLRSAGRTESLIYVVQFSTFAFMRDSMRRFRRPAPEGTGFSRTDYLRADAYLRELASTTGTPLYPAYDINDLDRAVAGIVEELHNEYTIGYYPKQKAEPGQVRRIEVRLNRPQLVVRARHGYVIDQAGAVLNVPRVPHQTPSLDSVSGELAFMPAPRSYDREKLPRDARWVCESPHVSSEFVVVKEGYSFHCPPSRRKNDDTNAWFVRRPGPIEVMCKGFLLWQGRELMGAPVPTGYVVTAQVDAPVCAVSNDARNTENAWEIKVPNGRMTVCKGFPIPRGFVVIGERTSAACPEKLSEINAWVIDRKGVGIR